MPHCTDSVSEPSTEIHHWTVTDDDFEREAKPSAETTHNPTHHTATGQHRAAVVKRNNAFAPEKRKGGTLWYHTLAAC
jgi:hypothetical protein